jgi:hypothetical protein
MERLSRAKVSPEALAKGAVQFFAPSELRLAGRALN